MKAGCRGEMRGTYLCCLYFVFPWYILHRDGWRKYFQSTISVERLFLLVSFGCAILCYASIAKLVHWFISFTLESLICMVRRVSGIFFGIKNAMVS